MLLGRKGMTNLDNILKSRDITLPTKVHIVKAVFFLVVIYKCESWTIKKAEHWRIDDFNLWCWGRFLRVLSLYSKEIKPVNSKGTQPWLYVGRTDGEAPILWSPDVKSQLTGKVPDAGKSWGQEKEGMTDGWKASLTQRTWVWANFGRQWRTGKPDVLQSSSIQFSSVAHLCCSPWGHKESDVT